MPTVDMMFYIRNTEGGGVSVATGVSDALPILIVGLRRCKMCILYITVKTRAVRRPLGTVFLRFFSPRFWPQKPMIRERLYFQLIAVVYTWRLYSVVAASLPFVNALLRYSFSRRTSLFLETFIYYLPLLG